MKSSQDDSQPRTPARRDRSARRRLFAVVLACAIHVGILALFLSPRRPEGVGGALRGVEVSLSGPAPFGRTARASASPPAPAQPMTTDLKVRAIPTVSADTLPLVVAKPKPPTPASLDTATPALAQAAPAMAGGGAPGAPCQILATLETLLKTDPAARDALARIPRPGRSVANAVMLWDGRWIDAGAVGGAATLAPLQESIWKVVAAADPNCRAEAVIGPQFIIIPEPSGAMVLALGSGAWRWQDLLPDPGLLQ